MFRGLNDHGRNAHFNHTAVNNARPPSTKRRLDFTFGENLQVGDSKALEAENSFA